MASTSYWMKQGLIPYEKDYLKWDYVKNTLIPKAKAEGEIIVKVLSLYEYGERYGKVLVKA